MNGFYLRTILWITSELLHYGVDIVLHLWHESRGVSVAMGFRIQLFWLKSENSNLSIREIFFIQCKSMLLGTIPHCPRCNWMHSEGRRAVLLAANFGNFRMVRWSASHRHVTSHISIWTHWGLLKILLNFSHPWKTHLKLYQVVLIQNKAERWGRR